MRLGSLYLHLFFRLVEPVVVAYHRAFVEGILVLVVAKYPTLAVLCVTAFGMSVLDQHLGAGFAQSPTRGGLRASVRSRSASS